MVKFFNPVLVLALGAPFLLTNSVSASCAIDTTIPTSCDGSNGWFPVSVVGKGVYCVQGPVCSAGSNANCPTPQAELEFGAHCAIIAPESGVYGCVPNDSCAQESVALVSDVIVPKRDKCGVKPGTPTPAPTQTEESTTYTPTDVPSTPLVTPASSVPAPGTGTPESGAAPGPNPENPQYGPVTTAPTTALPAPPGYGPAPTPPGTVTSPPGTVTSPPVYGPTPATTGTPESGVAPPDSEIPTPCPKTLTPGGGSQENGEGGDTPAPTPCSTIEAPVSPGSQENGEGGDTPAPTPCSTTEAPVSPGSQENGEGGDTPAPTPCTNKATAGSQEFNTGSADDDDGDLGDLVLDSSASAAGSMGTAPIHVEPVDLTEAPIVSASPVYTASPTTVVPPPTDVPVETPVPTTVAPVETPAPTAVYTAPPTQNDESTSFVPTPCPGTQVPTPVTVGPGSLVGDLTGSLEDGLTPETPAPVTVAPIYTPVPTTAAPIETPAPTTAAPIETPAPTTDTSYRRNLRA